MATIRKRRDKWQVRIRRAGLRPISKSFWTIWTPSSPEFILPAFQRSTGSSANLGRYLASVTMLNICLVDEVLEKYGPGLPH
jgi:hypothetical protein